MSEPHTPTQESAVLEIATAELLLQDPQPKVTPSSQADKSAVVFTRTSGNIKQRKGQTDEEYRAQRDQFWKSGPRLNTGDWFLEYPIQNFKNESKTDKTQLLHTAELCYFRRDYTKCLELVAFGMKLFNAEAVLAEEKKAPVDLPGRHAKKPKLDRHIQELLEIKEKCLAKMETS
ncbi:hypothetical protein BABINDRAFT_161042 [Babjeviella inositovora NRRL Y-12698]|uniref:Uncharacterized protein n=1 Tax=Babjeviella inositovora NRRL Y-12698 TaxID=984486 RepID=A0A1E3QT69_9ASCO|nr:uncharacterized protein BABINDRAFT_161042 [Babjeviella inositovora NRRL Y-12698]ODQ80838.1 hypothetical protein BABINDRAFT_161042 [Babjeviella inositovora NRRL Y-12698]